MSSGATTLTPSVAYDPVARVVTVTPLADQPFTAGQSYQFFILSPSGPTDVNGLRAIDGATLSTSSPSEIDFTVTKAVPTPPAQAPTIDFCRDILPMFNSKCSGGVCHSVSSASPLPAEGLLLTSAQGVIDTAIDQVAHGSNTGPLFGASEPPSLLFAEDVPIIDPGSQGVVILPEDAGEGQAVTEEAEGGAGSAADGGAGDASGDGGSATDATASDATAADGGVADGGGAGDATGAGDGGSTADATAADGGGGAADAATGDAIGPAQSAGVLGADGGIVMGDPAHSWILYKLLMSAPPDCSSTPGAAACDSGAPAESTMSPNPTGVFSVDCDDAGDPCPTALSDAERARLANLIQGFEMPYPPSASVASGVNPAAMTVDELELVSFWIAQGASLPENCQ